MKRLALITNNMRAAIDQTELLGFTVKFDFGVDGVVIIDGSRVPNIVHNRNGGTDCTFTMSTQSYMDFIVKRLTLDEALKRGLITTIGKQEVISAILRRFVH